MTLKQGNEVNSKFQTLQDSVDFYKKSAKMIDSSFDSYQLRSGRRLQNMYESYWQEYENVKIMRAESDSFRHMYMANKLIYLQREKALEKDARTSMIFSAFFAALVMFFSLK